MKLHRMTWREFAKHNSMADSRTDPDTVIPETYWFESAGSWFMVDKGGIGWNIYDSNFRNVGYAETLKQLRADTSF